MTEITYREWTPEEIAERKKEQLYRVAEEASRGAIVAAGVGVKHDEGKAPWHLLPFDAIREVLNILFFGASKYGERNWEKGMAWSRLYSAALRHLTSWFEGENKDPETGRSHLAHGAACVLFLLAYSLRGSGKDDRPVLPLKSSA